MKISRVCESLNNSNTLTGETSSLFVVTSPNVQPALLSLPRHPHLCLFHCAYRKIMMLPINFHTLKQSESWNDWLKVVPSVTSPL